MVPPLVDRTMGSPPAGSHVTRGVAGGVFGGSGSRDSTGTTEAAPARAIIGISDHHFLTRAVVSVNRKHDIRNQLPRSSVRVNIYLPARRLEVPRDNN